MKKEVAKVSQENNLIEFSEEQVSLIKQQIAPKATNDELKLFLYQAKRTGLDPLTRQIYCIHRNSYNSQTRQYESKMSIQTSIDGFRVVAERSGEYGGQGEPIFTYDQNGKLKSCTISVFKFKEETRYESSVGVAFWDEYCQTDKNGNPTSMWAKMPHVMLSKVCEALALRKAFPQDLSGLYTNDEMAQSETAPVEAKPFEKKEEQVLSVEAEVVDSNPLVNEFEKESSKVDWSIAVLGCSTIDQLNALFKSRKSIIGGDEAILTVFARRKQDLLRQ